MPKTIFRLRYRSRSSPPSYRNHSFAARNLASFSSSANFIVTTGLHSASVHTPTQSGSNVLLSRESRASRRQGRAFLHLARFLLLSLVPLLAPVSIISSSALSTLGPLSTNFLSLSLSLSLFSSFYLLFSHLFSNVRPVSLFLFSSCFSSTWKNDASPSSFHVSSCTFVSFQEDLARFRENQKQRG